MTDGAPRREASRAGRALRYLPGLTLAAVVTVTSTSEWTLARTVLDLPPAVAWAVPVAIDSYVIAALRTRRDVPAAIGVMAGALAAAMGAHLAAAERTDGTLPAQVTAPAAAVILSVLVVVAWRVHVLIDHLAERPQGGPVPRPVAAESIVPASAAPASTPPSPSATPPPSTPATASMAPSAPTSTARAAAAPRRAEYATRPVPEPHPATADSAAQRTDLTDAEIVHDLRATGDGTSPGIRALKRTYAIGQTRAARIHQQISSTKTQQQHRNSDTKKAQEPISISDEEASQETTTRNPQTDPSSDTKIQNEESHPGITDRVGRSRSTSEMPDGHFSVDSEPVFQPAGER